MARSARHGRIASAQTPPATAGEPVQSSHSSARIPAWWGSQAEEAILLGKVTPVANAPDACDRPLVGRHGFHTDAVGAWLSPEASRDACGGIIGGLIQTWLGRTSGTGAW